MRYASDIFQIHPKIDSFKEWSCKEDNAKSFPRNTRERFPKNKANINGYDLLLDKAFAHECNRHLPSTTRKVVQLISNPELALSGPLDGTIVTIRWVEGSFYTMYTVYTWVGELGTGVRAGLFSNLLVHCVEKVVPTNSHLSPHI